MNPESNINDDQAQGKCNNQILSAIVDSGANINIISRSDAIIISQLFNIQILKYNEPKQIEFAKTDTSSYAQDYLDTKNAIGIIDIIDDISDNLFSVVSLTTNGYIVLFTKSCVYIINGITFKIIVTGHKRNYTNLYNIDMIDIIQLPTLLFIKEFKSIQPINQMNNTLNTIIDQINTDISENNDYEINIPFENYAYSSTKNRLTSEQVQYVIRLHKIKNHIPFHKMAECVRMTDGSKAWTDIPDWLTPAILHKFGNKHTCLSCAIAREQMSMLVGSGIGSHIIGSSLSLDIQGPINPPTTNGCRYWFLVVDLATGFILIFLAKEKTNVYSVVRSSIQFFNKYGHRPKEITVDAGKVESSETFRQLSDDLNVTVRASPPRDQKSNTVERYKQTIQNNLFAVMLAQNLLDARYWGPALLSIGITHNENFNELSHKFDGGKKTPMEHVKRIKPACSNNNDFYFGELVIFPKSVLPTNTEPSNDIGAAVGKTNTSTLIVYPGSLIPVPRKHVKSLKIHSHNPTHDEVNLAATNMTFNESGSGTIYTPNIDVIFTSDILKSFQDTTYEETNIFKSNEHNYIPFHNEDHGIYSNLVDDLDVIDTNDNNYSPLRRSARITSQQSHKANYVIRIDNTNKMRYYKSFVGKARKKHTSDNPTHTQVMQDTKLNEEWSPARDKEISNFFPENAPNSILLEVTKEEFLASGCLLLRFMMLYKKKFFPDGLFDKNKVRTPVDGSPEAREGIFKDNKDGTFSPNLLQHTFLLLIAISVTLDLSISQSDVTACFLMTPMTRPVYAHFPIDMTGGKIIYYKLLRNIYGLIDSSREWFNLLCPKLINIGMTQSIYDPCLFIQRTDTALLLVGVTTDDLVILRSKNESGTIMLENLLSMMREEWNITYQEPATGIIGYQINYNNDGSITLKQGHTIEKIIRAFWPNIAVEDRDKNIPYNSLPMKTTWNEDDQNSSNKIDISAYLEKLGLMIFMLRTRFDICYTISRLSARTHKCTEKDMLSFRFGLKI